MGPRHVRPFLNTLIDVDILYMFKDFTHEQLAYDAISWLMQLVYILMYSLQQHVMVGINPVNIMNNALIEYNLINTVDVSGCYRQV